MFPIILIVVGLCALLNGFFVKLLQQGNAANCAMLMILGAAILVAGFSLSKDSRRQY